MLFGLFKSKKDKQMEEVKQDEVHDEVQYDVVIDTNFTDKDRADMKPIYTVKYYSKFKTSVNEAVFCKDKENGSITLNQAFITLEEILKDSIDGKLLIDTSVNQECLLTYDEGITIKKLEELVRC